MRFQSLSILFALSLPLSSARPEGANVVVHLTDGRTINGELCVVRDSSKAGLKYTLSNYRATDTSLIGAGTLDGEQRVPFAGHIPWADIGYIQTTRVNLVKSALAAGIVAFGGSCRIRIVNERPESQYTNLLSVLVVDTDPAVTVLPDASGTMHTIRNPVEPGVASGSNGVSCLPLVRYADGHCWESDLSSKDFSKDASLRDGIILEFPKPAGTRYAKLIVRGANTALGVFAFEQLFQMKGENRLEWVRELDRNPHESQKLLRFIAREGMLHISVLHDGKWVERAALFDVGPIVVKEQLAVLDVGMCHGTTLSIRLECATDLWRIDRVAVDYSADMPVSVQELTPVSAKDELGRDIRHLLRNDDSLYYGAGEGQSADLSYQPPPERPGQQRHYFAKSRGNYHQWFVPQGQDQTALLERIFAEPQLGGKLLMNKWRELRQA